MTGLTYGQSMDMETLLNSLGLGLVAADQSGKILLFNEAAAQILGTNLGHTALIDWPRVCTFYLADGHTPCPDEQSPLLRAIRGEEADNVELLIATPSDPPRELWCAVNLRPLKSESGVIQGGVIVLQDISERKKLAEEAARSNAALQQFASVAAHDLQEPIRTVSGFVDLLAENQGSAIDEESARCMSKIKGGVKRMQTLINDLLSYSRIQTKPQVLSPTDCNEIVEGAILNLNASIRSSGGGITFDQLPTVIADISQLSQLFENLLGNALKFAEPGRPPTVHVSAKKEGIEWLFSIKDNGIGIAKEFSEKIFLVFQRLHSSNAYPGTGIGLAVCQKIVERHGGRIWFDSEPGIGTTFHFTIRNQG